MKQMYTEEQELNIKELADNYKNVLSLIGEERVKMCKHS